VPVEMAASNDAKGKKPPPKAAKPVEEVVDNRPRIV